MSASRSHLPFGVLNRTANPIVRLILLSPAHRLLSRHLLLITVRGRRSGRNHVFPTGYVESDGTLTIQVGSAARKRWWPNLADGAQSS